MPDSANEQAWRYLEKRFGVERSSVKFEIKKVSGDYWLHTDNCSALEYETQGIRCLRDTGRGLKPTTYILQLLEEHLERNVVEVDREELIKLLERREMIERQMKQEGYVALRFRQRIIGCGYYKDQKVSSRIPKGRSGELKKIIMDD